MRDGPLVRFAVRAPFLAVENEADGVAAAVAFHPLRAVELAAAGRLPGDGGVEDRSPFGGAEMGRGMLT